MLHRTNVPCTISYASGAPRVARVVVVAFVVVVVVVVVVVPPSIDVFCARVRSIRLFLFFSLLFHVVSLVLTHTFVRPARATTQSGAIVVVTDARARLARSRLEVRRVRVDSSRLRVESSRVESSSSRVESIDRSTFGVARGVEW